LVSLLALLLCIAAALPGHAAPAAADSAEPVLAWGSNGSGELGDGTTTQRDSPVQVQSLPAADPISLLAGGDSFSLALTQSGQVWAWGSNLGQLGDGTNTSRSTPVQVQGLPASDAVTRIAAGSYHSLAVTRSGQVWAWGYNYHGELGDYTTTTRLTPVQVQGLPQSDPVTGIAAGNNHSLAVTRSGQVWAWGYNYYGELGDYTTTNRLSAVQVQGLTGPVRAVAAGNYLSMAMTQSGQVLVWGDNSYGQFGFTGTASSSSPVQIQGLTGVNAIAAGVGHSLAMTQGGQVWAWGLNNVGQLGDGTTTNHTTPAKVQVQTTVGSGPGLPSNDPVLALAAGGYHSLAMTESGQVFAWGYNAKGQLGNSNVGQMANSPVVVLEEFQGCCQPVEVTTIAGGISHSLAVSAPATPTATSTPTETPTSTVTTTPTPTGITYTITFDPNGGIGSPANAQTKADGTLSSQPQPLRDGYDFVGWFTSATGGTQIGADTVFTADTTIYAQWSVTTAPSTPTATATATLTETSTPPAPVSTATRVPEECNPRPNVGLSVVPTAGGDLSVTVNAQSSGATPGNTLRSLQFGTASNGLVDAGNVTGSPGNFAETLAPGTASTNFRVHRINPGASVTVPLTVFDACGAWPTFVGAGPGQTSTSTAPNVESASAAGTPPPTATPTPTQTPTETPTPTPTTPPPTATATAALPGRPQVVLSMSADPTSGPVGSTTKFSLKQSNISGVPSASNAPSSGIPSGAVAVAPDASRPPDGDLGQVAYAVRADQQAADVGSTYAQAAPTVGVALAIVGVEQRVPDGMTFISADNNGTYNPRTNSVSWLIRDGLPPGASLTLSYTARLDVAGSWTSAACVDAVDASGNQTNDCATAIVTVTAGAPTPTPTVGPTVVSAQPTSTLTLVPPPVIAAVRPTLTTTEEDVLKDVIAHVEGQGAPSQQVPVQVPQTP
jgi:uncharacterized repeat protein (TIGR02543 family)